MTDRLSGLRESIVTGDEDGALSRVQEALAEGIEPTVIVSQGLAQAMEQVGLLWNKEEIFLPEVVYAAEIFQECMQVLEPSLLGKSTDSKLGHFIIGTVSGDLHDLGKNMVAIMLRTAGFTVHDMGKDVSVEAFVEKVKELGKCLLGLSALLTTTMMEQRLVINALQEAGLREQVKVMVGGAPVTPGWAQEIGADGYAVNAHKAVELARRLVTREGGAPL
jgi:corrinoid protein of di/trimethylamine methyltransferase